MFCDWLSIYMYIHVHVFNIYLFIYLLYICSFAISGGQKLGKRTQFPYKARVSNPSQVNRTQPAN